MKVNLHQFSAHIPERPERRRVKEKQSRKAEISFLEHIIPKYDSAVKDKRDFGFDTEDLRAKLQSYQDRYKELTGRFY